MKQIAKTIVTILMCIVGTKAFAYDFEKDGFYYNLDPYDMTVKITYGENPYKGNVIIPSEVSYNGRTMNVTAIDKSAFKDCAGLSLVQFCNSIKYIGEYAFQNCTNIKRLTIPSNIKIIYTGAFWGCSSLEELIIEDGEELLQCGVNGSQSPSAVFDCKLKYLYIGRDIGYYPYDLDNTDLFTIIIGSGKTFISGFQGAKISTITIPSNVTTIRQGAFKNCNNLKNVNFEDSDKKLVWQEAYSKTIDGTVVSVSPFYDCPIKDAYIGRNITPTTNNIRLSSSDGPFDRTSVENITISNNVTSLCGIKFCNNIKEIVIPSSIQEVCGFKGTNSLVTIKCMNMTPPKIKSTLAENSTYLNGILYVPIGSIDSYKNDEDWGKFFNIQENENDDSDIKKCDKPTICYDKGKLLFYSATEGAICHSTITDSDISSYIANEVQLAATYNISVYATKTGYVDSDKTTATLCWIDVAPKTEGIDTGVAQVEANVVLIQSRNGQIDVTGLDDGTMVSIYDINGTQLESAVSHGGTASITTNMFAGSVAIVKMGNKSVKVLVK